jgi:Ca-activated chloride channel family protein
MAGWSGLGVWLGIAAMAAILARPAAGAGLLIADGGLGGSLEIKEHDVQVTVNNGIAVTKVTQVFRNLEKRQVEALYTFPVPRGASVANFSMWIGGKEMVGEVLEKQKARQIYESYKPARRDPGLLEQKDYRTFEMRVFPIGPEAEQRIEVTYYQELETDHDTAVYVYPLATVTRPGLNAAVTGKFAINADVRSAVPIQSVESPSHAAGFVIARHSDQYAQASLEAQGGALDRDVVLNLSFSRPRTGIDVLTSRTGSDDGYFLMTVTAGEDLAKLEDGMDYVFLLDISGSMGSDGKLLVSKECVEAFVGELQAEDRVEVVTFNVSPHTLFGKLETAGDAARGRVREFLAGQSARGGTVLKPAMETAYRYAGSDRQLNVVVLSDGMTEQQERQALIALIKARPRQARVFCIGVGNDVNRPLMEQMADEAGGLAAFVSRDDNFTRAAKAFRRKLTRPVATELALDVRGVGVTELEPAGRLPNLYHGMPVRVYGRYKGAGAATLKLTANVRGRAIAMEAPVTFAREDATNPEIERMWAWKRVDRLNKSLDEAGADRLALTAEIVRLGEAYSIVTEHTSFLVLENDAEYKRWQIERRNSLRTERDRAAQAARRTDLESIRAKAASGLGPEAVAKNAPAAVPTVTPSTATPSSATPATPAPHARRVPTRSNSQSIDLNFGTGPVGPLFVVVAGWLAVRRRRADRADRSGRTE